MSSPPEGGSSQRGKRHNNRPRQNAQEIPSPIDTASLHDYAFTFTQGYDDAVTASFRIEADPHGSASRSPDVHSYTSSLAETGRVRIENGRTYHGYKDGSYMYPEDEQEIDRQCYQYRIIKHLMNDKLFFAPWTEENPPRQVLDIACGKGYWAVDMGDKFPSARVTGIDLSEGMETEVPPNVYFESIDSIDPWPFDRAHFDYIHTRFTSGCWRDLKTDVLQKAFDHLQPGGYFEAQELLSSVFCDDGTMPDDWELKIHMEDLEDATAHGQHGRPLRTADLWKDAMREVGFVDVQETVYKIPINGWGKARKYKELGKLWEKNWLDCIHAVTVGPLHRIRGLLDSQIQMMLVPVRHAISDTSVHAYNKFYIIVGRKPHPGEQWETKAPGDAGDADLAADTEMSDVS